MDIHSVFISAILLRIFFRNHGHTDRQPEAPCNKKIMDREPGMIYLNGAHKTRIRLFDIVTAGNLKLKLH